jgi:hypothetical protein
VEYTAAVRLEFRTVTKPFLWLVPKLDCNGLVVTGKSIDRVRPVMYRLLLESTAIPPARSAPLPPRYVAARTVVAVGFSFRMPIDPLGLYGVDPEGIGIAVSVDVPAT